MILATSFAVSSEQCKLGAELCSDNANRLWEDAALLLRKRKYATASCLAIYTIEEAGKGIELLRLFKTGRNLSESKWKRLSRGKAHEKKILAGQKLAQKSIETLFQNLNIRHEVISDRFQEVMSKHYQWRKERYLYVDLDENHWVSPITAFGKGQLILAIMVLVEAFYACMELSNELNREAANLEGEYHSLIDFISDELAKLSNKD